MHDLRADMVDLLGATQAADLGIFVLDLASLELQNPYREEIDTAGNSNKLFIGSIFP